MNLSRLNDVVDVSERQITRTLDGYRVPSSAGKGRGDTSSSTSVTFASRTFRDVPRRREAAGERKAERTRGSSSHPPRRGGGESAGETGRKKRGREGGGLNRDGVDVDIEVITRYVKGDFYQAPVNLIAG